MEKEKAISRYRERLDKTLSCAELTDPEMLKTLVKNQILRYAQDEKEDFSEDLLGKRAREVSNLLGMLRSTCIDDHHVSKSSETSHGEWKLKHDNEEFRVMYREGPHGTPFHTLLVEGYVDGPLDVCLCISWESALYKKWWPQSSFPPFKINSSTCLQKVRIGEQISLVRRMKVAWPLSAREALVHFFFFEYFQEDLIVILVNTISDVSSIDKATHGFTNNGIPEAKDVVRIDMVGGFALQKVNDERSYFRTIANMDMKLDFVPPSLINFISRQLVGNGFRLYQKTVASVSNHDKDYSKALGDPLFALIREALYASNKSGEVLEVHGPKSEALLLRNKSLIERTQDDTHDIGKKLCANDHAVEIPPWKEQDTVIKSFGEIEEEETEGSTQPEEGDNITFDANGVNDKRKISIRPEVQDALRTLDKVISLVQQHGFNSRTSFSDEETANLEEGAVYLKAEDNVKATSEQFAENLEMTLDKSQNSSDINDTRDEDSNSFAREANHNKEVPVSPLPNVSKPNNQVALSFYRNGTVEVNGFHENGLSEVKKLSNRRKHRLGCFGFNSG
ncbi:hypothetical protein ES319_D01G146700v1 [Gossypium barbadense]|uniref:START domain-containing protein n=1 Tax=Gossypium barbadense TaxID=3634 RepID=A0A5J5SU12_GOSBA|nr:hypothetical protein ES319_D01G146700v1 [Gossypium barbadense]KAB2045241.1 hypothetical protein ES319_D01G146700v1 [Gossypium barbadense]